MSYLHESRSGEKVEYRRKPGTENGGILYLESRVLRPDGTPYSDGWYTVSDRNMLDLQLAGSDIVDLLAR